MPIARWLQEAIQSRYDELAYRDYPKFVEWLESVGDDDQISADDLEELKRSFSNPKPRKPPELDEDDDVDSYMRDPPDPGPLAQFEERGWFDSETAPKIRLPVNSLKDLLQIKDTDVVQDIQENALHILGRCNDPKNWGENRNGLVYGMIQSGKTASMISLIALARRAGYNLFIVLAGDKTSLRNQTQDRINDSFRLENGVNAPKRIHSPTWNHDFGQIGGGYTSHFRYADRFGRDEEWATIIVVKKNTNHLKALIEELKALSERMGREHLDFASEFPALVIDDEADYASQNTNVYGDGTTIHGDIVDLRDAIPRNTYVGYTATPQACLSASPEDPIGYPKDFFWLLEPYMDQVNGDYRPRTYLGAWEVFWDYDHYLVHEMPRDAWPHYEKDPRGKSVGIYVPPTDEEENGTYADESRREVEEGFLDEALADRRTEIASLTPALVDFMIGCGIRWWRQWKREGGGELPSKPRIEREYGHHAAMVHLSEKQEHQMKIRTLVQRKWFEAVDLFETFEPNESPSDHLFRQRWRLQMERTTGLTTYPTPTFQEVEYFIQKCIEIAGQPINNHRERPYRPYPGKPFVYLLNASDDGMELFYDSNTDPEIKAKKASIVVGGNILSRGLTIEGLCVSVFGRASQMPIGDAMLQMGRWFGHKLATIDLFSIFVQDEVRNVLAQVAETDRYLRLQIKDAIMNGYQPTQVLLEMMNSPFFRITSPSKSVFLQKNVSGKGFTGQGVHLNQPSFTIADILHNRRTIDTFAERRADGEDAHNRAFLYRNVPPVEVIKLLRELRCPDDASIATFGQYADYLEDWMEASGLPSLPRINIAVWKEPQQRRRVMKVKRPTSAEEARRKVTNQFGPIIGGRAGEYRGDAFLDKDRPWHQANEHPTKKRDSGDEILIVFYLLNPNYVTKTLYVPGRDGEQMSTRREVVRLEEGDPHYISVKGYGEDDLALLTYAAWTPAGGPMYDVMTNALIDASDIRQRGRDQLEGAAPDGSD